MIKMDHVEEETARFRYDGIRRHPRRQIDSDSDSANTSDDDGDTSATECRPLDDVNYHHHHHATPTRNQLGKSPRRIFTQRTVNALEVMVLIAALGVVVGLFTLPVVFYFKDSKPSEVNYMYIL